jgi:hypothetical protein
MATPAQIIDPQQQNSWDAARASKIALGNYRVSQTYRSQNTELRYRRSMELYLAATNPKYWPGTKVPSSSMPIYMALAQIEALLPHIDQALFGTGLPFGVTAFPGTSPDEARAKEALMRWQLLFLDPTVGPVPHTSLREIFRQGCKGSLIFGNSIVEMGWLCSQQKKNRYDRMLVPNRRIISDPMTGEPRPILDGYRWQVSESPYTESISKPTAQHVPNSDFYWDPACPTQNIHGARYCARRQFPTVSQLLGYQGQPGFTIPDRAVLIEASKHKNSTQADSTKQMSEASRGKSYIPTMEYNENPDLCRVEVIRYYQTDRAIWVIPGCESIVELKDQPLYNAPNEYQMLPFLTGSYIDVPNRWEGLSLCELVDGDQQLAKEILDAMIDELNLWAHPPIVRNKQMMSAVAPSQRRMRPGVEWEVEGDVRQAVTRMDPGTINVNANMQVDAIDRRVTRTTGNSDMAVMAAPSAGGDSSMRTATGVAARQTSSNTRIQYQVVNLEDQVLTPLLYFIDHLNRRFLDPETVQEVLGPDGQFITVANADVMNAECQFEMQAARKMRQRNSLASGGLQVIMETYLNGPFLQLMADQGKKVNVLEISNLTCDTLGIAPRSMIIDMTPQEIQQRQQQAQQADMIRMQMQRERLEAAAANQQDANETKTQIALVNKLLTPDAAHEAMGLPSPAEIAAKAQPKTKVQ